MSCVSCGKRSAREWAFCPYCGTKIEKKNNFFNNIEKMFKGLVGNFNKSLNMQPTKNNKITIRFVGPDGRVVTNVQSPKKINARPQERVRQRVLKMPDKLVEPESKINRLGNELEVTVELPGIKSLNEINLVHLGESIEVRAVSKDKGYFKIISVPENYHITNKSINNETLSVKMGAR